MAWQRPLRHAEHDLRPLWSWFVGGRLVEFDRYVAATRCGHPFGPLTMIMAVTAHPLAHVNALLNATAAVLLVIGYAQIRHGSEAAHRRTMLTAFGVSIAFLVSYVAYHMGVLGATTTRFSREGTLRTVYLSILASHVLLAATVPFLASITIYLGFRCQVGDRRDETAAGAHDAIHRRRHRTLARWTLPIWLYVSITGVVIYLMLYHLFPGG